MADIVLNNVLDKQDRKNDANYRECQKQIIDAMVTESVGEEVICVIQGVFQCYGCKSTAEANQYTEDQYELVLFNVT
jgi:hypothetical protein